ncbi:unnamed protein product [Rangifer tarandus platyrhynchus]|uniref:Uncharacterized protein n=2 Tax=Rangifer tarandus platyrhynchus TaxID=3082113 RepID=A0ACB0FKS6_RANTA|nr:unnamed protein product [Rangifer tarandus platyrhynchus]CAI9713368.1 unnamed protein product [Rangifer tarandus platyrhynchus]
MESSWSGARGTVQFRSPGSLRSARQLAAPPGGGPGAGGELCPAAQSGAGVWAAGGAGRLPRSPSRRTGVRDLRGVAGRARPGALPLAPASAILPTRPRAGAPQHVASSSFSRNSRGTRVAAFGPVPPRGCLGSRRKDDPRVSPAGPRAPGEGGRARDAFRLSPPPLCASASLARPVINKAQTDRLLISRSRRVLRGRRDE